MPVGQDASGFPQTGDNRTRESASIEIAEHHGGSSQADVTERAGKCWDAAVRQMNAFLWKFNLVTEDITLSSPVAADATAGIVANSEYNLSANFKFPFRAILVDSSSKPRDSVQFVNYGEWLAHTPDQSSTTSSPTRYTARNIHQVGRIIVSPPLSTSSLTWPTLRLVYFRPIDLAEGATSKLAVPVEVDEAIFQLAVANFESKVKGPQFAQAQLVRAHATIAVVQATWRDYADIEGY
jgi:hypothetical protein